MIPALASISETEVTLLGRVIARSARVCIAFRPTTLSCLQRARQISPYESRSLGYRELLVVNSEHWSLEMYRLANSELTLVNQTTVASGVWLDSEVVSLAFRLIDGVERPRIEVRHSDGTQTWIA